MLRPAIEFLETRYLDSIRIPSLPEDVEKGSYEVLIVDDGSKDETVELALKLAEDLEKEFGAKRGKVKVCSLVKNRGKGGATKHVSLTAPPQTITVSDCKWDVRSQGVLHASGHRILFVDADGATNFTDLSVLEAELDNLEEAQSRTESPHGIIVGSRAHLVSTEAVVKVSLFSYFALFAKLTVYPSPCIQRSLLRNLLMRSFHLYLSLLGLRTIRDTQCGFKLHTRASASHLYPSLHSPGWIFDCELLLLAELTGVPLREVGVRWHEVGGSKLDVVWDSVRMARDLLVIRGNHLTGRWKSPKKVDVRIEEKGEGRKDE